MNFPKMYRVRQSFDRTRVKDIPATVKAELDKTQPAAESKARANRSPDGRQPGGR